MASFAVAGVFTIRRYTLYLSYTYCKVYHWQGIPHTPPQVSLLHSRLTRELTDSLEMVQKTCLRVILGDEYEGYPAALDTCGLETLFQRREARCLTFAQRCLKHPTLKEMFPLNQNNVRNKHTSRELYEVNFART